jgi:hypothetical protein
MNRAIEDSTRGKILKTPGMLLSPVGNLPHISILYINNNSEGSDRYDFE